MTISTVPTTTTTTATTGTTAGSGTASTGSGTAGLTASSAADLSNRFLTLLVAQMSNQDPLNPMDSSQVTSQMAQISTVEGVQNLNTSINSLSSQFTAAQTLQGAALVGKMVATQGDAVRVNPNTNVGDGGFELAGDATDVKVAVVNSAGQTIDTLDMGALQQGRHSFAYPVPAADQGQALTFQVTASSGSGSTASSVSTMTLQYNDITAVSNLNGQLALELDNGQRVSYGAIWAFL